MILVDKYIIPLLHYQINVRNSLLEYGKDYRGKIKFEKEVIWVQLEIIDSFIRKKLKLWFILDLVDEGKQLADLKNQRRKEESPITNTNNEQLDRHILIDELSLKRFVIYYQANNVRKHNILLSYKLRWKNRSNRGLTYVINLFLYVYLVK